MRVATWNVNSLKARLPRVEEWLTYASPDVLCLQETKCADAGFPSLSFQALGYDSLSLGDGRWNGVAIVSRVGLEEPAYGFADGIDDPLGGECRLLAATCGGVRIHTVYAPNGRSVGSDHYELKLEWLGALEEHLRRRAGRHDVEVIIGDFNIAPDDRDVWDASRAHGGTHVSASERDALRRILDLGYADAFRLHHQGGRLFSWWDYRAGDFHNHRGMRIDLALINNKATAAVAAVIIDRNARKGRQPSDHAPMFLDINLDAVR